MKTTTRTFRTLLISLLMAFASDGSPAMLVQTKITPSDGARQDYFGDSVALNGGTLVVGASLKDVAYADAGAVYVYVRNAAGWIEQQKLVNTDVTDGFSYGTAMAISGDTLVVGCPINYLGDRSVGGAAYVYTRSGGQWSLQQRLAGSSFDGDNFGYAVAMSGDTVVVGASGDVQNGVPSGSVYIFVRQGSAWVLQQTLAPGDATPLAEFGTATAISGDTVLIGAIGDGVSDGSAYVFTRSGTVWTQAQKLMASDAHSDDGFGLSVGLTTDTAVIGAPRNSTRGNRLGSAYFFGRAGLTWVEQQKLEDTNGKENDQFGHSVAVSGERLVVGSVSADNSKPDTGSADLYVRSNGGWSLDQRLLPGDLQAHDVFGHSVALTSSNIAVGALEYFNFKSGAVYLYETEKPANTPPVANAGPDLVVECSDAVLLDGRASTDDDGDSLTYDWREEMSALGSGATLSVQLPLGVHLITLKVTDPSGASSEDAVSVTVVDRTPPAVTCPAAITVSADANCQAAVPDLLANLVASDNCTSANDLVKVQSPSAGTLAPLGSNSITITVTDASGNSTSCSTALLVRDATAPVIRSASVCPNRIEASGRMVPVTVSISASDNCDSAPSCRILSISSDPGVSSTDWKITGPLTATVRAQVDRKTRQRVYAITVQCTDNSGNSATKVVAVTVSKSGDDDGNEEDDDNNEDEGEH